MLNYQKELRQRWRKGYQLVYLRLLLGLKMIPIKFIPTIPAQIMRMSQVEQHWSLDLEKPSSQWISLEKFYSWYEDPLNFLFNTLQIFLLFSECGEIFCKLNTWLHLAVAFWVLSYLAQLFVFSMDPLMVRVIRIFNQTTV